MQSPLPKYCKIARAQNEVDDAQRLRFRSIATDLNISVEVDPRVGREISSVDNLGTTHHLLLYCGQELIGTARLALPNAEVATASGTRMGFELEQEFDLGRLPGIRESLAEVARVCILPPWRSTAAVLRLYEGLYCLSRELGVDGWIGAVDCQTSRADEAELMLAVLQHRSLVDGQFRVGVRSHGRTEAGGNLGAKPFYSDAERAQMEERLGELRIASTLSTFTRRLGARCVGRPARHPAFPRFVLPMLVDLDRLPPSTLAKFDLSQLGPSLPSRHPHSTRSSPAHDVGVERMAS